MDREGEYIEYNGQKCIIVAFDGAIFWLVPEERIVNSNQIFSDEMFIKVPQEEIEEIIENSEGLEIE